MTPRDLRRHMTLDAAVQPATQPGVTRESTFDSDEPVLAYPETAILELPHVAAWLRISERSVEGLDIPFALLGQRTKRYLAKDVIAFLEKRSIRG